MRPFIREWKEAGLELVLISRDDPGTLARLVERNGLQDITVLLDPKGEVMRVYRVKGLPETLFIDRTGVLRHVSVGYGKGSLEEYRRWADVLTD